MVRVLYLVETRREDCWAVMRQGPKGGTRLIAVYRMRHQAVRVAATLNNWSVQEW